MWDLDADSDETKAHTIASESRTSAVLRAGDCAQQGIAIDGHVWRLKHPGMEFDTLVERGPFIPDEYLREVTVDRYTLSRLHLIGLDADICKKSIGPSEGICRNGHNTMLPHMPDLVIDLSGFLDPLDVGDIVYFEAFSYSGGIFLASILYGGLHAVAWNAAFPSYIEKVLWRASCGTVVLTVLGFSLLCSINRLVFYWLMLPDWLEDSLMYLVTGLIHLLAAWYVLCRAYLVVECFINLAYLSPGVLEAPNWTQYLPHIV